MINKRSLLIKMFYFVFGLIVLSAFSLLDNFNMIAPTSYLLNSIFVLVCIVASLLAVYYHSKASSCDTHLLDVIISFAMSMLIYCIYFIPIFNFYKLMGANNSIIFILVFVLYSLFLREVSVLVRKRETLAKPRISNKIAYKSNYYAGTIIRYISNVLIECSFATAVFNTVYPVVDMSLPFDFFVLGK